MRQLDVHVRKHHHALLACHCTRNVSLHRGWSSIAARRQVGSTAIAHPTPAPTPTEEGPPAAKIALSVMSLYTSQIYKHRQALGPVQLEIVSGKGLGWRATRDVAVGELLFVSLPIAVLYGAPGEPPTNEELAEALRQAWPRLSALERRWLLLLGDCCAASGAPPLPPLTPAEVAATSARPDVVLEELLLRARSLLAEAQQTQATTELVTAPPPPLPPPQQQPMASEPASAAAPAAPSSLSASASSASASSQTTAATAAAAASPSLPDLLAPKLFGATPSISTSPPTHIRSPATATGGGGGGIVGDLVRRYSYSESYEDPVLEELLEVPPVSCVGLWPEAALLNHSCCPNTAVLVVGGAAYVRAGRAVMEGEELTVSYLGRAVFQDVAERRSRLRTSHGFLCTCPRCTVEHYHFPTRRYRELELSQLNPNQKPQSQSQLQQQTARKHPPNHPEILGSSRGRSSSGASRGSSGAALDDAMLGTSLMGRRGGGPLQAILDAVFGAGRFRTAVAPDHGLLRRINGELVTELEAAAHATLTAAARPRQQQAALLARMEGLLEQVEDSCAFLELPPRGRLMTLASVYGLVRLLCDLAELSQGTTPLRRLQMQQLAAEVLETVAPGSDSHVMAAIKAAGVARRVHGADSAAARRAELAAGSAHLARYGRELLSHPALLRRLAATRRRLATGSGLAASMGVLAWLGQVGPG